ncbi:MAG TPA: rhomboid family intramembrane serine protease [Microvirga sp.]|jgi:membrane associated rhomboid family serine protease|nr:rhomboid family intramembrane serine protease [Microvirga sp.]
MIARPSAHPPIFNLPRVVLLTIAALVAIHAVRAVLDEATDFELLVELAVVPARWAVAVGAASAEEVLRRLGATGQDGLVAFGRYVLDGDGVRPWTALTYAALHGSWTHLIFNGVWLAAFGTPVARRCGAGRYLALAAATAVAGAAVHVIAHPADVFPMIGASAAVSGMTAAAAWFMFAPARWSLEGRLEAPHERRRESLAAMVRNRQVVIFVAVWFVTNTLFGTLAQPFGMVDSGIAWEAHVGGFLAGLALFPLLDPLPRQGVPGGAHLRL